MTFAAILLRGEARAQRRHLGPGRSLVCAGCPAAVVSSGGGAPALDEQKRHLVPGAPLGGLFPGRRAAGTSAAYLDFAPHALLLVAVDRGACTVGQG